MPARTEQVGESKAGRRTRARLKELLLEAAEEVLDRDGLGFTTDTVTYKTVFAHLEESQGIRVTRGSVHERIWDSQRDFQLEVLHRAAKWTPDASNEALVQTAARVIGEADLTHREGRIEATRRMIRESAREGYEFSNTEDHWHQWLGLTLALGRHRNAGSPESRLSIDAARTSYRQRTDELVAIYRGFLKALSYRVRPGRFPDPEATLKTMTRLITALADGIAVRERFVGQHHGEVEYHPNAGASPEKWHLFSVAAWAVVDFFLEAIPDDDAAGEEPDA